MAEPVLTIEPTGGRFDRADSRWLDEVASLHQELRSVEPTTRTSRHSVPGTKGVVTDIVVPLVSAGALTGIVEALRIWLSRDDGRTLRLQLDGEGRPVELELTGDALSPEVRDSIVASMLASIGDG